MEFGFQEETLSSIRCPICLSIRFIVRIRVDIGLPRKDSPERAGLIGEGLNHSAIRRLRTASATLALTSATLALTSATLALTLSSLVWRRPLSFSQWLDSSLLKLAVEFAVCRVPKVQGPGSKKQTLGYRRTSKNERLFASMG
jgi:hypothetical protein